MRALILFAFALAAPAQDDRPERPIAPALQARVNIAIGSGCAHLRSTQQGDGSWVYPDGDKTEEASGGLTALAAYALASSRTPVDDPAIRKALRWLQRTRRPFAPTAAYSTYANAFHLLALARVDATRHRTRIRALAQRLTAGQLRNGAWTYQLAGARDAHGDNSNTQLAVMALWTAQTLAGVEIPPGFWRRVRFLYEKTQLATGGWAYRPRTIPDKGRRPAMDAAGAASLAIAEAARLGGPDALAKARTLPGIGRARKALRLQPRAVFDPYFSYAVERAATVLGLPLDDWYVPGARRLVARQAPDGRWHRAEYDDPAGVYATSLALLFLSRATIHTATPGHDGTLPKGGPVTARSRFPDPGAAFARAFEHYVAAGAAERAKVRPLFAKAGAKGVGRIIRKLRDGDEGVRAAAYDLLVGLVDKSFFFDPAWPVEERTAMVEEIERFWSENGPKFAWNAKRGRFVLR